MRERKNDRVVLDTNIIVSLLLKEDFLFFVDLKFLHNIKLYTCAELIDEVERTLKSKKIKKYLKKPASYYTSFVKDMSEYVTIDKRFDRSVDPDDNYLFDLAYTAKSYYLVTGERALLNMKHVNKIEIISLSALRKML